MRGKMLLFLASLCLFLMAFGTGYLKQQTRILEQEAEQLRSELRTQELQLKINQHQLEVSRHLLNEILLLRQENGELHQRMKQWLDSWEVDVWEATAYAPIDPKAQEGMCYEGNPEVTASGAQVIPYTTAAAGPDVEFGKRIYVVGDGPGWYRTEEQ